jgi:hypothetical protein
MDSFDLVDVLAIAAVVAIALGLERLGKGRFHWLETAFLPFVEMRKLQHPDPPRGVQEDDDVHWNFGPRR